MLFLFCPIRRVVSEIKHLGHFYGVRSKPCRDKHCGSLLHHGKIGSGGMGQVYSAISFEDPSRTVAIKLIQRDKELSSEDLLRFQKEAALMSQLHHQTSSAFTN